MFDVDAQLWRKSRREHDATLNAPLGVKVDPVAAAPFQGKAIR